MSRNRSRWSGTLVVNALALAAVSLEAAPLVVVALLYWIDLVGGLFRRLAQVAFAGPRETYSPTEPPATTPGGDTGPLRFLIPKLGAVRLGGWLPPATPYNLRVAALLCLSGPVLLFVVAAIAVNVERPPVEASAAGALAGSVVVVAVRHGWTLRRVFRSERPPVDGMNSGVLGQFLLCLLWGTGLVGVVAGGVGVGALAAFTIVAAAVVARLVYRYVRSREPATNAEPVTRSEPDGRPIERFRADGRAVRIAGALDGFVPRVRPALFNAWVRLSGWFLPAIGVFWAVVVVDLAFPAAVVLWGVPLAVAVGGAFVLLGVAHFELAFGAMEYRLYESELVAYDTRLDAVQWRAPLASIHDVTVADGWWLSPPGTDAGTVRLERSDLETTQKPYGFVRQSLVCVEDPEGVADRLRRETRGANAAAETETLRSAGSEA